MNNNNECLVLDLHETAAVSKIRKTHDPVCPAGEGFRYPDAKIRRIMKNCWKKDPYERPDFTFLSETFRDFFKEHGMTLSYMIQ